MRRREFIALIAGGTAAWPLAARAQQAAMPVIGFLNSGTPSGFAPFVAAFLQGLTEAGYIENQNVAIEYRWAEGQYDRLPALAADLVRRQVTLIAATTTPAALAAKAATTTIPIVFTGAVDPVAAGIVISLNRPGDNITGVNNYLSDLGAKRVELLHELVPNTVAIGMLVNPTYPNAPSQLIEVQEAARRFGVQVHALNARTEGDFDGAFATLIQLHLGGLLLTTDGLFLSRRDQIVELAARHKVPTVFPQREFVLAGGLMSYAADVTEGYHQAAVYVARILKGAKPGDLPIVQPTKFDLLINLKSAKALGLDIPAKLLALADEVIE
jgi:putative ABC transport system substrate-binding protein